MNKEIKRRADVVSIFPNDEAVIRLVGALMLEQSDEWAVSHRYFSLEILARLADTDPTRRLPWQLDRASDPNRGQAILHHPPGHGRPWPPPWPADQLGSGGCPSHNIST